MHLKAFLEIITENLHKDLQDKQVKEDKMGLEQAAETKMVYPVGLLGNYLRGLDEYKAKGFDFLKTVEARMLLAGIAAERITPISSEDEGNRIAMYREQRAKVRIQLTYAYVLCGGNMNCMIQYLRKTGIRFDEMLELLRESGHERTLVEKCFTKA